MKKSTREITEGFKLNDNENSTYQTLLDTSKAALLEFLAVYILQLEKKKGLKLMIKDSTLRS